MSWQFASPVQLVFGSGSLSRLAEFTPWDSILVVTTPGAVRRKTIDRVLEQLSGRDVEVFSMVTPGPQLAALERAADKLKQRRQLGIVALGGGSTMDTAKTGLCVATNGGSVVDYLGFELFSDKTLLSV